LPLFDRSRPVINQKRFATRQIGNLTSHSIKFENASPSESDWEVIHDIVVSTVGDTISVSNHPSISSGRIIRFFIGQLDDSQVKKTVNLTSNCEVNPEDFLTGVNCVVTYLFGHIVAKRRQVYGFKIDAIKPTSSIPYSPPEGNITTDDNEFDYQVMFVDQNIDDSKIKVSSVNVNHYNSRTGVSVIRSETLNIDTWYNDNFKLYNNGDNVTIGYLNDKSFNWNVGDRYNWNFGTVSFTSNICSEIHDGINYEYMPNEKSILTENGMEVKCESTMETIKLIAWKFFVNSIGTEEDPYKDSKHNFNFNTEDVDLVSDIKINYYGRKYDKAKFINTLKSVNSGNNIEIYKNLRGNIIIAKRK
jgi:hypothetical protein